MKYNYGAVSKGTFSAIDRLRENYTDFYVETPLVETQLLPQITDMISSYESDERYKDRFISFYVEISLVAQLVRFRNHEPLLTREELQQSFRYLATYFNSFVHD
ncbi:MAG: hypothetical protein J7502_02965 [Flavisolibacter sp.]|nr:hypothetical protein [Flavisolibacter sp.]